MAAGFVRGATARDVEPMLDIYGPIVEETAISFELDVPSADEFATRVATVTGSDPWLVYVLAGRVLGYAYASDFRSRSAYGRTKETTVYVDAAAHGSGVGHRLMQALLDRLAAADVHTAIAGIVPPNPASITLHERLGYRQVAMFHEVGWKFDRWHDLGFWQKSLVG